MSDWNGRLRSSSMAGKDGNDGGDDGGFTFAVLQAFQQDCVVQQLQKIFRSSIAPLEDALRQMNETNAALRRQIAVRDETIRKLELRNDDIEQQGRKGSIRIFAPPPPPPPPPAQGQGTLEQKLMKCGGVGYGKLGRIVPDISWCPQMDHVTGPGRTSQNIERSQTGNTCYSYRWETGRDVIGL